MPRFSGFGLPRIGFGGGSQSLAYWQNVKSMFGANLIGYWTLWEESGVTALDQSGNSRNGTYHNSTGVLNGVTLAALTAQTQKPAPVFDGANGYCNIYSAGLNASFPWSEGSLLFWAKVSADSAWTDGVNRRPVQFINSDFTKVFTIQKTVTSREVTFNAAGKSVVQSTNTSLGWMLLAVTWSVSNNRMRAYYNGAQTGSEQAGVMNYTGAALSASGTVIGAGLTSPATLWSGGISDVCLINREAAATEILSLYNSQVTPVRLTILGDSIAADAAGWAKRSVYAYNNGHTRYTNHAVIGSHVMDDYTENLTKQVEQAANDAADVIIIELGTNDDDAGDMTALQNKVKAGIDALRASNPKATLYYLNVLPRWTDVSGATPVAKNNIRAAIAAACAAKSVMCWDTYTSPWITAAQTADGLHPSTTGHAAISTQVLARL